MKPKPISAAEAGALRVVIVTLDHHLSSACANVQQRLVAEIPGLQLEMHAAADWEQPEALQDCLDAVARADLLFVSMLFLDDQIRTIKPHLEARRDNCLGLLCCMSAGELVKLTHLDRLDMSAPDTPAMAFLKKLRGGGKQQVGGSRQMTMLRRLPQILRFIPGTAQDLRSYFQGMQYWLSGSEDNLLNLVCMLVERYVPADRLASPVKAQAPIEYPEVGLYHPRLPQRMTIHLEDLPLPAGPAGIGLKGRVAVLVLRSYVLAGDSAHYDGVIAAIEARGLQVVPIFASGLDSRPAIERFLLDENGRSTVDALLSLTGFSLVGGPAYNDSQAAQDILARLDVPYLAAHPLEFQSLEQWEESERGLTPVESTIMVAIPELDGCTGPLVYGGRRERVDDTKPTMQVHGERAAMLAARLLRLVRLRRAAPDQRRLALVIFNFPPNSGGVGTAQNLSVFTSLLNTLRGLQKAGYQVDVPATVDELRDRVLHGNASRFGTEANVHARIPVAEHIRREKHLNEIEAQWGPAPGRQLTDGSHLFVLGERFGDVFIGIQPAIGYEGDPMRLLFERGFAPTHAFSAFYRWLRDDFNAHACVHFGTHGALEFMPGKQTGLSEACWPDRLIGDLPHIYLYAGNNPSEGSIAKRRSAATLISYMTPPVARAGLYRGLIDLKESLQRERALPPEADAERVDLIELIADQAVTLDLLSSEQVVMPDTLLGLWTTVTELEQTLIPTGLHVMGETASVTERAELLAAMAESSHGVPLPIEAAEKLAEGASPQVACGGNRDLLPALEGLTEAAALLAKDHELPALLRALDARYIRPAPGGDVLRTADVLPSGRNIHGFDPFRIPSAYALHDGARQAQRLLDRHQEQGNPLPRSIALVLWGTDTLKTEGSPIGLALALMGAQPRFDAYGRLCGADVTPLTELGRPRVDVLITLSGIFRDLLPLQTKLLAQAALACAQSDEPDELNPIRANALKAQAELGCSMEDAALRVFSNADGAYGANVGNLVYSAEWEDGSEIADTYSARKSFAYGTDGKPVQQTALLKQALAGVDLAYQNLDSMELGVTSIDYYFDTLGGISKAVELARGSSLPVYIGDQTVGEGRVRTLSEQVAIEARTRMLNPKWYEGMLSHGYEGVRQIEQHVANTLGWSATTGQVDPWVYQRLSETFVLDEEMRRRLAALNPAASAKLANRLLEAQQRNYWQPDADTLDALQQASEELEDRLEGVFEGVAHAVAA